MRCLLRRCGLLLPWLLCPVALAAQSIHGTLRDADSEQLIPSATITLLNITGTPVARVVTDAGGRFVFTAGVGRFQLRAEQIGYHSVDSAPIDLQRGDSLVVELRLAADAVPLAPLTVVGSPRTNLRDGRLDDFYERRARGRGRFFTPQDVDRIRPVFVSNLLQMAPGVRVTNHGIRPVVTVGSGLRQCTPQLFIDGLRAPLGPGISIDGWVDARSLRAVEVYRSRFETPIEFSGFSDCGAIVVWTDVATGDSVEPGSAATGAPRRRGLAAVISLVIAATTIAVASR